MASVGVGIGIVILIFVIILGLNVYAISNLEFRAQSIDNFSIFPDLNIDMNMETCNPTFFPASYKAIYIDVYYKHNNLGTATLYGSTIPPGTSVSTDGNVDLHSGSVLGSILDAIGSALLGNSPSTNDVKFKIKLDAPILGFIPFTLEKSYSYNEFSQMIGGGSSYGCSIQNPIQNFGQIESKFENEIKSLQSALNVAKQKIESVEIPTDEYIPEHQIKESIHEEIESSLFDQKDQFVGFEQFETPSESVDELFNIGKKYYDLRDCKQTDYYFNKVLEMTTPPELKNSLAQTYINLNKNRC